MPAKKRTVLIVSADALWAGIVASRCTQGAWKARVVSTVSEAQTYKKRTVPERVVFDVASIPESIFLIKEWKHESTEVSHAVAVCLKTLSRADVSMFRKVGVETIWLKGHVTADVMRSWLDQSIVARPGP